MSTIFLFVLGVISSVLARNTLVYNLNDASKHFEIFRRTYNKVYDESEFDLRFQIFMQNLKKINHFNEKSDGALFGINKFTDLTSEEFIQKHTGYISSNRTANSRFGDDAEEKDTIGDTPESFNWCDKGVVSDVKDQGHCKCCWSFSITGNLESLYAIKNGQSVNLSEQQLVDCDSSCSGCDGGDMFSACKYLQQYGSMTEKSYPYEGIDDKCRYKSDNIQVNVANCLSIEITEDELADKLIDIGPLSFAIDSTNLQIYTNGILQNCDGSTPNHAVLLVGYGKDENGNQYWLVKNSWSKDWGEEGYFRMPRGKNCLNMMRDAAVSAVL